MLPEISQQAFFLRERFVKGHFANVDRFIAPSAQLMEKYLHWGIEPERIEVEEYGRRSPAVRAPAPRADQSPGQHRLLRPAQPFQGRQADAGGDGDARREVDAHLWLHGANLELQAQEFQDEFAAMLEPLRGRVTFRGPYDHGELPKLMADLHWVVVPSIWWENSPLVIQEAFFHRRPIICSDVGGMAEKVSDGVDGMHFRVGDAYSLARTIETATTQPAAVALAARRGYASRTRWTRTSSTCWRCTAAWSSSGRGVAASMPETESTRTPASGRARAPRRCARGDSGADMAILVGTARGDGAELAPSRGRAIGRRRFAGRTGRAETRDRRRIELTAEQWEQAHGDLKALVREELASLDAGRARAVLETLAASTSIAGEHSLELSRSLYGIREVLRERLPRCEVDREQPVGLAVEQILAIDDSSFWINGWMHDEDGRGRSPRSRPRARGSGSSTDAFRYERPDVVEFYAGLGESQTGRHGFTAHFSCRRRACSPSGWIAELRTSDGLAVEIQCPPVDPRSEGGAGDDPRRARQPRPIGGELAADHGREALTRLQERIVAESKVESIDTYGGRRPIAGGLDRRTALPAARFPRASAAAILARPRSRRGRAGLRARLDRADRRAGQAGARTVRALRPALQGGEPLRRAPASRAPTGTGSRPRAASGCCCSTPM